MAHKDISCNWTMDETIRVIVLWTGFKSENEIMIDLDLRCMGTPQHFRNTKGCG